MPIREANRSRASPRTGETGRDAERCDSRACVRGQDTGILGGAKKWKKFVGEVERLHLERPTRANLPRSDHGHPASKGGDIASRPSQVTMSCPGRQGPGSEGNHRGISWPLGQSCGFVEKFRSPLVVGEPHIPTIRVTSEAASADSRLAIRRLRIVARKREAKMECECTLDEDRLRSETQGA